MVLGAMVVHPAIVLFLVALVLGVVGRIAEWLAVDRSQIAPPVARLQSATVCVVVVVPSGVPCDGVVREILGRARWPHCIRLHVVKAVTATETHPTLGGNDRIATRVHLARARNFDPSVARVATVRRAYADEQYVCTLPHDSSLATDWDHALQGMLHACEEAAGAPAVLSTRPMRTGAATFTRIVSVGREGVVRTEAVEFAEPPDAPQPSAYVHAPFAFMRGASVRHLPAPSSVRSDVEDGAYGRAMWTSGHALFAPHVAVVWSDAEPYVGPPRKVGRQTVGAVRTALEYDSYMGVLNGRATRRARLGLTPRARTLEVIAKYGTVDALEALDEAQRRRR